MKEEHKAEKKAEAEKKEAPCLKRSKKEDEKADKKDATWGGWKEPCYTVEEEGEWIGGGWQERAWESWTDVVKNDKIPWTPDWSGKDWISEEP